MNRENRDVVSIFVRLGILVGAIMCLARCPELLGSDFVRSVEKLPRSDKPAGLDCTDLEWLRFKFLSEDGLIDNYRGGAPNLRSPVTDGKVFWNSGITTNGWQLQTLTWWTSRWRILAPADARGKKYRVAWGASKDSLHDLLFPWQDVFDGFVGLCQYYGAEQVVLARVENLQHSASLGIKGAGALNYSDDEFSKRFLSIRLKPNHVGTGYPANNFWAYYFKAFCDRRNVANAPVSEVQSITLKADDVLAASLNQEMNAQGSFRSGKEYTFTYSVTFPQGSSSAR